MSDFVLQAEPRSDQGKGASRRLRRTGRVPAVMYGAGKDPVMLTLDHDELVNQLKNEAFFSSILTIKLDKSEDQAIIKDLQRHPGKPYILHMDLQRVSATEAIRVQVPLHFMNEEKCPGVKEGGVITHNITEVEVSCLPKHLPEYIELDLVDLDLDQTVHLTDLKLPEGVELVELMHGDDHDQPVVAIHLPRAAKEEEEEGGEEGGEEAAEAGGEES
ncbi:50S ribosomal protein L25/general stress protein Ctc [Thiohalophilus thiocyanatoxydans]|uniref:Large ribosomal subunit protein bL25 n=1 Tax=Thiohalophilus thiocyanatoxydans TaxID=381308 RepID=A0A4R8INM4_9GAMM|nr:50S ribosomal protein L25/general stress protein Ctc [Thiohalophilus thiocyanatoxydans]TDX97761.1 large subunit ribosomal protein L25 [Thiohalophilus thiocyanatoxydans]